MTNRPRHDIAIVAGADSGIGQATAKELTTKGNAPAPTSRLGLG
jgi:NADP-dependent 3-hydroxy acid dehydrogenase YdfG